MRFLPVVSSMLLLSLGSSLARGSGLAGFKMMSSAASGAAQLSTKVSLGAGCYWGTEKFIKKDFNKLVPGSIKAGAVGFMNPDPNAPPNPTYRQVCGGKTGYVEVYDCEFDGKEDTFEKLMKHFFTFHDASTLNRQGNDAGTQYASAIFCYDQKQAEIATKVKAELQELINTGKLRTNYQNKAITTAIVPATKFYEAQADHQAYLDNNPWGYCNHATRFTW